LRGENFDRDGCPTVRAILVDLLVLAITVFSTFRTDPIEGDKFLKAYHSRSLLEILDQHFRQTG